NRLREGRPKEAADVLRRANDLAPLLKGKLNGQAFEGLSDCDQLFGPVLEVMAHGRYYWVPLEQGASLMAGPPRLPRPLLWSPAQLDLHDGASGEVFVPALYPGSHEHPEDRYRLGRETDYRAEGDGPVRGVGARAFLVGDDMTGLLEWRE